MPFLFVAYTHKKTSRVRFKIQYHRGFIAFYYLQNRLCISGLDIFEYMREVEFLWCGLKWHPQGGGAYLAWPDSAARRAHPPQADSPRPQNTLIFNIY